MKVNLYTAHLFLPAHKQKGYADIIVPQYYVALLSIIYRTDLAIYSIESRGAELNLDNGLDISCSKYEFMSPPQCSKTHGLKTLRPYVMSHLLLLWKAAVYQC